MAVGLLFVKYHQLLLFLHYFEQAYAANRKLRQL